MNRKSDWDPIHVPQCTRWQLMLPFCTYCHFMFAMARVTAQQKGGG